jgi:hypothetical protein
VISIPAAASVRSSSSRHQHGVVEIQDDRGVVFAFGILIGEILARRPAFYRLSRRHRRHGKQVMIFERTMLIYKRDHSPEEAAGY